MNDSYHDDSSGADETPFMQEPDDTTSAPDTGIRPAGLTVICVLSIVLSILGLFGSCMGLASQALQSKARQTISQMQNTGNQQMAKVQKEFNERIFAIADRYRWATLPLVVAKMVVEFGLLIASTLCLRLDRPGRAWLRRALVGAIVVESLAIIPVILIQTETSAATTEMMSKMMESSGGANPPPAAAKDVATMFGSVIGFFSIGIAACWLLGKLVVYVLGVRYLGNPEIVQLFALRPDEAAAELE